MSDQEASAVFSEMAVATTAFLDSQGWSYEDAQRQRMEAEIGERQWQTILAFHPQTQGTQGWLLLGLWPCRRVESPDYFAIVPKEAA